jgi:epoxyqueuosine reductase
MEGDFLKKEFLDYGEELGFSMIKVTAAEVLDVWDQGVKIRNKLDPEARDRWKRMTANPKEILPDAQSIIVAVWPYVPYVKDFPHGVGRYSAHYREYPVGREKAKKLGSFLEKRGYNIVVDPPLPVKAAAHRAGIGCFGKNSIIYAEGYGSWITLHCILTNASMICDESVDKLSDCNFCEACIRACPTGAIQENGIVLPNRCIRNYMLSSDFIPLDIRDKIGTKLLGCDICQQICPKNREIFKKASLPSADEMDIFNISKILSEWKTGLADRMERMAVLIGKNYARAQKVLSMAVIIAGNTKDPYYMPLLAELLSHPHPPIRGHSAWALGKIGGEESKKMLREALESEKNLQVIKEIEQVLKDERRVYGGIL